MRHRRHGVKREHSVIDGFGPVYERLARLPGVEGVIPGRIANNPTHHPGLVLKVETPTGFKLLAKTTTSIQEVFLITRDGAREQVRASLGGLLARPAPARSAPAARTRRPPAAGRTRRNPGVLPAGPRHREPIRYSAPWGVPGTPVGHGVDAQTRRRLLWLRLRRVRWRRRFGAVLRRAPRRGA